MASEDSNIRLRSSAAELDGRQTVEGSSALVGQVLKLGATYYFLDSTSKILILNRGLFFVVVLSIKSGMTDKKLAAKLGLQEVLLPERHRHEHHKRGGVRHLRYSDEAQR